MYHKKLENDNNSSQKSNLDSETDKNKCKTYADLQDKFCSSSADSDSEDISEIESFGIEEEVAFEQLLGCAENRATLLNKSFDLASNSKFLLAAASAAGSTDYCVGDCGAAGAQALHHHHTQPKFDPDTQAKLVALLEAANPEVLRQLTSSVSSALDEAAAALTRMRTETVSGQNNSSVTTSTRPATVGGSSSSKSCSSSSTGASNSCEGSAISSRSSSTPSESQRTLVEACTDGDLHTVKRLLDEGRSVHQTTKEGDSLLSLTCSAGFFELAKVLLEMRANVEDRGVKGDCTPLMEAASAGHVEIVRLLLSHKADFNAQSTSGNTPLMYACGGGHLEIVKILLDFGANVEDHNENGHTPLMEAASAGHVKVAKLLLEKGAGINTSSNEFKESALTLACYKGHLNMVKFLLEAGADQEHKTDEMHTALMEASMDGHVEVARLLLDSGAQVNMPADSFESPLTLAACGGHTDLALLLLDRGANIEEVNDEGYTPLMEAAREGHEEMVTLLLASNAEINAQTEETQETSLTLACCGGFKEVGMILIKAGADLELGAATPLMEAAQEGHRELVRYLIDMGANVNAQTSTRDTALTYASENGHTDVASYLLRANADLEHESEGGRTPLMKACRAGHICTVQFLVMRRANVNKTTADNDHTPLSLACVGGHNRIVEFLLANGADPHHKLKDNSTMLMEAAKGGHTQIVKLLMDYPNSLNHTTTVCTSTQASEESLDISSGLTTAQAAALGTDTQQAPVLTNASNQIIIPETGDFSDDPNLMQMNRTNKANRRNLNNLQTCNYLQDTFCAAQGVLKEDILLDNEARGTAKILDAMQREIESHNSREGQILVRQQVLEQLHEVEKKLGSVAVNGNILNSMMTNQDTGAVLNAAINNQVLYSSGAIPGLLPHNTHTAETQTAYLPTSGWTVLPTAMGLSDLSSISSSLKPHQLSSALYTNSTAQVPLTFADGSQTLTTCPQEAYCEPYLSPNSPPSLCFPNTSPPSGNVPVHERRKMVPSKKQLDKKKFQFQQMQLAQQHQCNLHYGAGTVEAVFNCPLIQTDADGVQHHVCVGFEGGCQGHTQCFEEETPPPPPPEDKMVTSLLIKPKPGTTMPGSSNNWPKHEKKDKKRSISSPSDCDCGMHGDMFEDEILAEATNLVPSLSKVGAPLHINSPSGKIQFMPTSGSSQHLHFAPFQVGSGAVPLQYNHLNALNQTAANQSAVTAAVVAQQLQGVSSTGNFTPTLSNSSAIVSQSHQQSNKYILKPPQNHPARLVENATSVIQELESELSNERFEKRTMQCLQDVQLDAQKQLQDFLAMGHTTRDISEHMQPQQGISTAVAGLGLDAINPSVIYQNGVPHFPVTSLPISSGIANFSSELQVSDGLMVSSDASKFERQLQAISTNAQTTSNLSVPYSNAETANGTSAYDSNCTQNGAEACHYPPPLVDLDSETDSNHDTALTLACAGGHDELVELLLQRGANIEHCDKKGFTPLILAATAGHSKVVEALLNHNANIEAQSERTKDTPLSLACSGGRYECVDTLLSRGAIKEHRNVSDYTPLSLAASGGYVNIIKLLLEHGAEINSRTGSKLGISPLMLAAMNGHTQAVKMLLDMGSDINAQIETNRNTALTLACFQGRHEVVSLLLDRKANVEHRAKTGLTPLMEAASGGYVEVGKVLIEKGADVNAPPVPSSRDTALTIAADKGHLKFVELLIIKGAQTEVKNKKGNSPMWLAANGGHIEVVQALLNARTDINSEDNRKVSCLMTAFKKGHLKLVKFMVKHVSQFPSDQELERYMCTLNDEELRKKCKICAEFIRTAKEKQAQEANKNAANLLDEVEKEKNQEEIRRASAMRKKQKKKARKQEKKEEKKKVANDDEEDEEDEMSEVIEKKTEKEKPRVPAGSGGLNERVDHPPIIEEKDCGDSGIDSNSQTSASSEPKVEEKESKGKKKKKKEIMKENNKNKNNSVASAVAAKPVASTKEKIVNKAEKTEKVDKGDKEKFKKTEKTRKKEEPLNEIVNKSKAIAENSSNVTKAKKKKDEIVPSLIPELADINLYIDMKPVGGRRNQQDSHSRLNALDTFGEVDGYISSIANIPGLPPPNAAVLSNLPPSIKNQSPKKLSKREEGWKEVSRKSKRVSVPNSAISRVIGRGGSNINTIREVSGAHIEVEKQGKSQGDRMIVIKGSVEATKQAQILINALVKDPDKDLSELIPKSIIKVAPKIAKTTSMSGLDNISTITFATKGMKIVSTAPSITAASTTFSSVYSSAKAGFSTPPAWASIVSPKRTPATATRNSAIMSVQPQTLSDDCKSPVVRQLFPGDKLLDTSQSLSKSPVGEMSSYATQNLEKLLKATSQKGAMQSLCEIEPQRMDNLNVDVSEDTAVSQARQYSIFNNLLGQMPSICNREKPLNFAKAASEGLGTGKTPLGQQPTNAAYLENIELNPIVDASRAPGFRGTVSTTPSINAPVSKPMLPPTNLMTSNISPMNHIDMPPSSPSISGPPPTVSNSSGVLSSPIRNGSMNKLSSIDVSGMSMSNVEDLSCSELIPSMNNSTISPSKDSNSQNIVQKSAPGTPISSPIKPIAPPTARQFATPPPMSRQADLGAYCSVTSRTPPPSMPSLMRIQVPPPPIPVPLHQQPSSQSISVSNDLANSFASAMYITSPPTTATLASLAPGGPVSTNQRQNDVVNLAVGQPYRKVHAVNENILTNHEQLQQQLQLQHLQLLQQVQRPIQLHNNQIQTQATLAQQQQISQHQPLAQQQQIPPQQFNIAAIMNGLRFTTPQTNTQPVFTNNILAPITTSHHIQSNLNPNAPDFSSRAAPNIIQGPYSSRNTQQLPTFPNGITSMAPSIYNGLHSVGQYTGNLDNVQQLQPGLSEMMSNLLPRNATVGTSNLDSVNNLTYRSTGGLDSNQILSHNEQTLINMNAQVSMAVSGPTSVQGSVATICAAATVAQPQVTPAAAIVHTYPPPSMEDKHSKLQPIGTERAQKRSERVNVIPPNAGGMGSIGVIGNVVGSGGEQQLLWTRSAEYQNAATVAPPPQVESIIQPSNIYYPTEIDMSTYNAPLWNWNAAGNPGNPGNQ